MRIAPCKKASAASRHAWSKRYKGCRSRKALHDSKPAHACSATWLPITRFTIWKPRTAGVFVPLLELNSQAFLASILILGGYRVLSPGIGAPAGELIQFMFLANIFFAPIQTLGDQYNQAMLTLAGADRVRRFLAIEPDWIDRPAARPIARLVGEVTFDDVSFAYQADRLVLENINFSAAPGQCIALVGHTGSGKSSIINLIAKFYLPTRGRVLIDGYDIRDLQTSSLHRQMGIVQQQNFLFCGTVADNVRFGRPEATDDRIADALETLGCYDLVTSLPGGLHADVGECGKNLSLGQRQLVCFAGAAGRSGDSDFG